MILSLQDSGGITIYHSVTGEPILLASKATRKARRAAKEKVKLARIENRAQRKINRQESKTARQSARQHKKMVRITGKENIIKARQKHKIDSYKEDETTNPYQLPSGSSGGGSGSGGGGGGGGASPSYSGSDYDDTQDFETTDTVEGVDGEDYEQQPDDEQYDEQTDETEMNDLSAGSIFGSLFKGIGTAVKSFVGNEVKPNLPINLTSKQVIQLQNEKMILQSQLQQAKTNQIIFGVGGLVVGGTLAYLIKK